MRQTSLDDKYDLNRERVFVTGSQAVIRLALMQHARDAKAGLRTAGYISGYRGSPIGGLDQQLARLGKLLAEHDIVFQPGLNEDLAATALWGTQQAELRGEGKYDGVFGLWYGKGPGVDRSGDAFRHANHAGTSKHGGVLALMGDDHTCESSTSAHQSEFAFVDAMMPVLNPAGVQEILDYGLYGWALSRYAGVWTGLKCVKDNIEQTASVDGRLDRVQVVIPQDFTMPPAGLNIRLGDTPLEKEARLHLLKRPAMLAFIRANKLDRMAVGGAGTARIGIATTGKSYLDVAEAFDLLGLDEARCAALGIRLYKIGVTWPLESQGIARFADGLELVMVVEEKRSLVETQIKEQLYGKANAPIVVGKRDEEGAFLFPPHGALEPVQIAIAIGSRILKRTPDEAIKSRLQGLEKARDAAKEAARFIQRIPYFCAGCPHNTSTRVPEGSRAYAGIGCHYMAQWMDRSTEGFTQMGGEGANWVGEAPFSKREHVFQNLGDGTYIHSGILAIRSAIVAGTNVTFKLLYNDAVAMTGGQPIEGPYSVPQIARQLAAEGVKRIEIVADDPEKYPPGTEFPLGVALHEREALDAVQRSLVAEPGVSVLIYDQTCAAEKRRRRKRGAYPDPAKRVLINELVCEGCGDCGVQSNCVAIVPVETEFGRKRAIDQSACNKDYSCLNGFCPSFVTVHGGELRKGVPLSSEHGAIPPPLAGEGRVGADLSPKETGEIAGTPGITIPDPKLPPLERPYSIVIAGVGGTGVVTIGALIGMAAHIEGKGVGIIDMSGLAQKGGAVAVHVRVGAKPADINAIRASAAGADLVLGCDMMVAASDKTLAVVRKGVTSVLASNHETMTGEFTRDPDIALPTKEMQEALRSRAGVRNTTFIDAQAYAQALLGDTIAANMFLLGFAYQRGLVPVGEESLLEAIRLNGVAVDLNKRAFQWGRLAAHDENAVAKMVTPIVTQLPDQRLSTSLDEMIARRVDFLTAYQNKKYAARYAEQVAFIRSVEAEKVGHSTALTEAVARNFFKLMAYKDEYEVARLYTDGSFQRQLEKTFTGDYKLEFHLAPPILTGIDPRTGRPRKRRFGPRMMTLFRVLAWLRFLRGTDLDPFGFTRERRRERRLIRQYELMLEEIAAGLTRQNHATAIALAEIPQMIRGFGPVKREALAAAAAKRAELLDQFGTPPTKERRRAA